MTLHNIKDNSSNPSDIVQENAEEWDDEWDDEEDIDDEDLDGFLERYVQKIPNLKKYSKCVFYGPGMYFVVSKYGVTAMPDDPGCYVKGGSYPDFQSYYISPTKTELLFIRKMMSDFGFKASFLDKVVDHYNGDFCDSDITEYFKKEGDKVSLSIYRKIVRRVNSKTSPFNSVADFLSAFDKYGTASDLYYMWEDSEVSLHDNIYDGQESLDYFNMDKDDWMALLDSLDERFVMPDDF